MTAEDPAGGFLPQTGTVRAVRMPEGPGVRVDSNLYPGQEITLYYDPMIGKVIVHGRDRDDAIERLKRALTEMRLVGILTCAPLLRAVLDDEAFRRGDTDTGYLERFVADSDWQALPDINDLPAELPAVLTAVLYAHQRKGASKAVTGTSGSAARSGWVETARAEMLR